MMWLWIAVGVINGVLGYLIGRNLDPPMTRAERRWAERHIYFPPITSTRPPSSLTRVSSEFAACSEDE